MRTGNRKILGHVLKYSELDHSPAALPWLGLVIADQRFNAAQAVVGAAPKGPRKLSVDDTQEKQNIRR
jgi:hypothetical protein